MGGGGAVSIGVMWSQVGQAVCVCPGLGIRQEGNDNAWLMKEEKGGA